VDLLGRVAGVEGVRPVRSLVLQLDVPKARLPRLLGRVHGAVRGLVSLSHIVGGAVPVDLVKTMIRSVLGELR